MHMNKYISMLAAGLALWACTKEPASQEETKGVPMTFEISVDAQTKASKTEWVDNDFIYVFFNGLETKYLMLAFNCNTGEWVPFVIPSNASLTDTDFEGLDRTLTAVYFPTMVYVTFDEGQFKFTRDGEEPFYGFYLLQAGKAYEIEGTTVKANLSLEKPADFVQVHVPGLQNEMTSFTFGCSLIRPVACTGVGVDGKIVEKVLQPGARLSGIFDSDGELFSGRLTNPGEAADYTFTLADDSKIYTLKREEKALEAGKQYNFPALTETEEANWTVTGAGDLYVDLGLPSGLRWTRCNLGAPSEIEYGAYYAWGELQPKEIFEWDNYLFNPSGDSRTFTKYTGSDFTVLQPEDDAAYAALGGNFRMPTKEDWAELLNNTTSTWTQRYGVDGRLHTAANGNSIFFPAAGYIIETATYSEKEFGFCWSSSLSSEVYGAWEMYFNSSGNGQDYPDRYEGNVIRPVYDDPELSD